MLRAVRTHWTATIGALALGLGTLGATASATPTVIVQAGHVAPREPGYRWQTGAPGGPFGSERAFNRRTSVALVRELRRRGYRARVVPGLVTPWAARADMFISIHHDGRGGLAGVGFARAGTFESYYRGDGAGAPSRTPFSDTVPHRRATSVNRVIEGRSRRLATAISRAIAPSFTPRLGAHSGWDGVLSRRLVRVSGYYGYRRTRARSRVIVEVGAAGADDVFLRRTTLIARLIAEGVERYAATSPLRARGASTGVLRSTSRTSSVSWSRPATSSRP